MSVTKQRVQKFFDEAVKEVQEQTAFQLGQLGEELKNYTRARHEDESWHDVTGNLRSSIGASVIVGGKEYYRPPMEQVKDGAEGVRKGNMVLDEAAKQHKNDDYALIVAAGEDYASFVEEMEGKDVLASTELKARHEITSYVQDAIDNAMARINRKNI